MERTGFLELIERKFKIHRIIALLGPRQCRKTTLAKAFCQKIPNFPRRNYFDLENPNDFERLQNPYNSLRDLTGLIVIDEVQRSPELFPVLRALHDEFNNKQYLILGSASKGSVASVLWNSLKSQNSDCGHYEVLSHLLQSPMKVDNL